MKGMSMHLTRNKEQDKAVLTVYIKLVVFHCQYAKKCLHGLDFESIMGWIVSQISKVDARVDKHASMFNFT